jgi:hypothetical protein
VVKEIQPVVKDWVEHYSNTYQRPYWRNTKTGETSWERKPLPVQPSTLTQVDKPTNNIWVKTLSKTRNKYYWFNPETKESVWENPDKKGGRKHRTRRTPSCKLHKSRKCITRRMH